MTKVESSKIGAKNKSPGAVTSTATLSRATSSTPTSSTASSASDTGTGAITSTTNSSSGSSTCVKNASPKETTPTTSSADVIPKTATSNSTPPVAIRQDSQGSLTTVELQVLSELDSTQFGFVRLNEDINARKKSLVVKAIKYLERFIVRSKERQRRAAAEPNNNGKNRPNEINPSLYCKLGHLHLLLENFSKALSAYQTFFRLKKGSNEKLLNI